VVGTASSFEWTKWIIRDITIGFKLHRRHSEVDGKSQG